MGRTVIRPDSRGRRWGGAAVLGVALPLVVACWSASAAGILPSPTPNQGASAASPTPCPIIVLGTPDPSCGPTGVAPTPTPTNSATPVPTSSNAGPGSGSGSGGGNGSGSGGGSGNPPAGSRAAAPGAAASSPAAAGAISINPPALLGLLNVLNAPANVGVERPLLHHFDVADADGPAPPSAVAVTRTTPMRPAGSTGHSAGPALALVAALLAAGAGVAALRRYTIVALRRRIVAVVPLVGVAAVGAVLLGARPAPGLAVTAAPHAATPAERVISRHVDAVVPPVLQKLTEIEADITSVAHRLVLVATTPPDDNPGQPSLGVIRGAEQQSVINQLTTQYDKDLQSEYAFFTSVVPDDTQRTQLLAAAASAPQPIAEAVTYNVGAVQAMLQQEAAIAAAQAAAKTVLGPVPTSLLAPEQGVVTQGFGPSQYTIEPPLTFNGVTYPHFHTGIDICDVLDTPIHAAANGVVVIAGSSLDSKGNLIGYGNYIVLQHAGKMITLYAHLDKLLVKPGQVVKQGDVIGLEGSTGYSTGPHLHFEVRIASLVADPMKYLGTQLRGPVA